MNFSQLKENGSCLHLRQIKKEGENFHFCFQCCLYFSDNGGISSLKSMNSNRFQFLDIVEIRDLLNNVALPQLNMSPGSIYLKQRRKIVRYLFEISERLGFSNSTAHVALFFLDYLNSKFRTKLEDYELYVAGTLFVAAKSVEFDQKIPLIEDLRNAAGIDFDAQEIYKIERILLILFEWKIRVTTLYDLVEFFLFQGVIFSDEGLCENPSKIGDPKENDSTNEDNRSDPNTLPPPKLKPKEGIFKTSIHLLKKMLFKTLKDKKSLSETNHICGGAPLVNDTELITTHSVQPSTPFTSCTIKTEKKIFTNQEISQFITNFEKNTLNLVRVVQLDYFYWRYSERSLAAAIIAYSRKHSGFDPFWNNHLTNITGVSFTDVKTILKLLESNLNEFYSEGPSFNKVHRRTHSKSILINNPRDFVFSWEEILDSQRPSRRGSSSTPLRSAVPLYGDTVEPEEVSEEDLK